MRTLLRLRNARIYLLGDVVSTIGDYSLWLAMAIWMKEMTGSSAWAGLVMFCFALGSLFSPLGGVIADRFPRRPLLICANLLAAADVLLILLVHDRSLMWLVYAVVFVYGVIGAVTGPAEMALLPSIVPPGLLAEANGAQQSLTQSVRLVTPLLGAGLFAWLGAGWVAGVDAATFGVAVVCLALLRITAPAPGGLSAASAEAAQAVEAAEAADVTEAPEPAGGMSAGFRFLIGEPVLRAITITLAIVLLTMGFTESAGFSVVTAGLHRSASFIGVLGTVQGVGGILGGLVAAALLKRTSELLLTLAGVAALTVTMVLLAVPNLAANLIAMLAAGLVGAWLNVAAGTALQTRTPNELLGRVSGIFGLVLTIPQITSVGLGAALIAVVNYRVLLLAVAAVSVIAALYLLSVPETRRRAARSPAVVLPQEPMEAVAAEEPTS